jgi:hypothetical protein
VKYSCRLVLTSQVLFLALFSLEVRATQLPLKVIGEATDAASGKYLYSELHYCSPDQNLCNVSYENAEKEVLALKSMNYASSAFSPEVQMQDLRFDKRFEFTPVENSSVVVDAGFDNYVRTQWQPLLANEVVSFRFLPLGFERPITMQAAQLTSDWCEADWLCLRVAVDSWWLGLVADPIDLAYDLETRRLLEFRGVSNLKDVHGNSQKVVIRYQYASDKPAE